MPINYNSDGYFMASWMFYDKSKALESVESWKKRWADEYDYYSDFGNKKRKIRVDSGEFKSYNTPIRLLDLDKCWFYFQTEDVVGVKRLIDTHVYGIGKKVSQGYGLFSGYKLERLDSNIFEKEIVRPIPFQKLHADKITKFEFCGYRPPYWLPENQGLCRVS